MVCDGTAGRVPPPANLVMTSEQEPDSKEMAARATPATLDKLVDTRP
jgi:hypothetical protein